MLLSSFPSTTLSSWGSFKGQQRKSDSPYVENVWEGTAQRSGMHLTAADAAIDLVCLKRNGVTRLLLSGPTSKVYAEPFDAGDESLTIRLRTGIYLPLANARKLIDAETFLPSAGSGRFWLHGYSFAFPGFDNVETFIEHLARMGLLSQNVPLDNALQNRISPVTIRTMQRHSLATTGLTMNRIRQIKRAETARSLLSDDDSLIRIAYDVGYSNPAHMTNAFKYFFGQTPSALRLLMRQDD